LQLHSKILNDLEKFIEEKSSSKQRSEFFYYNLASQQRKGEIFTNEHSFFESARAWPFAQQADTNTNIHLDLLEPGLSPSKQIKK
jgi:hypothetical protein